MELRLSQLRGRAPRVRKRLRAVAAWQSLTLPIGALLAAEGTIGRLLTRPAVLVRFALVSSALFAVNSIQLFRTCGRRPSSDFL